MKRRSLRRVDKSEIRSAGVARHLAVGADAVRSPPAPSSTIAFAGQPARVDEQHRVQPAERHQEAGGKGCEEMLRGMA